MSGYSASDVGVAGGENPATIEIEIQGRWDALALSEVLIPYRSFLVQHDHERWVVHARAPGCHGEPLDEALGVIAEWLEERRLGGSSCRVDGRPYRPGGRGSSGRTSRSTPSIARSSSHALRAVAP